MPSKLISKKKFAEKCGVSGAAVTKACSSALKRAHVNGRIDESHKDAIDYYNKQTKSGPYSETAPKIHPRYEEALQHCMSTGRWSASSIQKALRIGWEPASKMFKLMEVTGVIPSDPKSFIESKEKVEAPKVPHVRGPAAKKEKKKQESLEKLATTEAADADPQAIVEIPENLRPFVDLTLRELLDKFGTETAFNDWLSAVQKIEMISERQLKNAEREGLLISRELVKTGIIDPIEGAFIRMLTDGAKVITARTYVKAKSGVPEDEARASNEELLTSFIRPVKDKMKRILKNA